MAFSKKSITDSEIEAILCESSDDEVDTFEFEELYDCDTDAEYVQEPSDNSDLEDVPPRKKKNVVHVSPALPVGGPAAPPTVAPAAPCG